MSFFKRLFTLPGSGYAAAAQKGLAGETAQRKEWVDRYFAPGLEELWRQYLNPDNPLQQALMGQFAARTARDYTEAGQRLQQGLAGRGLGQSGMLKNSLAALWNGFGQTMANARQQDAQAKEQKRQQALARLMAAINPEAAMELYQRQFGNAQQMGKTALGGLGELAKFV